MQFWLLRSSDDESNQKLMTDSRKVISKKIAKLNGTSFEKNLLIPLLQDLGFKNIQKQSSGYQGGFDIRAELSGREWRFEAKKKMKKAVSESDLARHFDQIEKNPGNTEYFIIVTNCSLSNPARDSIEQHRQKWLVNLDYWSDERFWELLLSCPETVVSALKLGSETAREWRAECKHYQQKHHHFLKNELKRLKKSSNRFRVLQRAANSISDLYQESVRPATDLSLVVPRDSADASFVKFVSERSKNVLVLTGKEQTGKTSLLRTWAEKLNADNIVFFYSASSICKEEWLVKFEIELFSRIQIVTGGTLQLPGNVRVLFENIQDTLKARNCCVWIFVDALNAAPFRDLMNFVSSNEFLESLKSWNVRWVFSCRSAVLREWAPLLFDTLKTSNIFKLQEISLGDFTETELRSALKLRNISVQEIPMWLWPQLGWPGALRILEKWKKEGKKLSEMPEIAVIDFSLIFMKDRIDEFARLIPADKPTSYRGVEEMINRIIDLIATVKLPLPFDSIKTIEEFNPHRMNENSWNILLQQGFLTKQERGYSLSTDWGAIILAKRAIELCLNSSEASIERLLDQIFDAVGPSIEALGKFAWFFLFYGRQSDISHNVFAAVLNHIFQEQNLNHAYFGEIACRLFPKSAISYLTETTTPPLPMSFMAEGLKTLSAQDAVDHLLQLYPYVKETAQGAIAGIIKHFKKDLTKEQLAIVYSFLDSEILPLETRKKVLTKDSFRNALIRHPEELCNIIKVKTEEGKLQDPKLALAFLGMEGTSYQHDLLKKLTALEGENSPHSLCASGKLQHRESEELCLKNLNESNDLLVKKACIVALGNLRSTALLTWCRRSASTKESTYPYAVAMLIMNGTPAAITTLVSMEKRQKRVRLPSLTPSNRMFKVFDQKNFERIIRAAVNQLRSASTLEEVESHLRVLSGFSGISMRKWWKSFKKTRIPEVIARKVQMAINRDYFITYSRTISSEAIDAALLILRWIGKASVTRKILLQMLSLPEANLGSQELFATLLTSSDKSFVKDLIRLANLRKADSPFAQVTRMRATVCLSNLPSSQTFDALLGSYPSEWFSEEKERLGPFGGFRTKSNEKKLISVLEKRDDQLLWGAIRFLMEFRTKAAIKPALRWLQDCDPSDWKHRWLIRLLSGYDSRYANTFLIRASEDSRSYKTVFKALLYSKDPIVRDWYREQVRNSNKLPVENYRMIQWLLLNWILMNPSIDGDQYVIRWLNDPDLIEIAADGFISLLYKTASQRNLVDDPESLKSRYTLRENSHLKNEIMVATLKYFSNVEPDWSWSKFTEAWSELEPAGRKQLLQCIRYMPSQKAIEWILEQYVELDKSEHTEKELKSNIVKAMREVSRAGMTHGKNWLQTKARSSSIIDRVFAAHCSGLFGLAYYNQLKKLADDHCARVRFVYSQAHVTGIE
ncbi:restriction endonuclease [bacterium]|nr:restriction endonuclease [bacterium]